MTQGSVRVSLTVHSEAGKPTRFPASEPESDLARTRKIRAPGHATNPALCYPLTAPCMMPLTSCFPATKNSSSNGITESSTPARTTE
jgi:hypothetical protein